MMGAITDRPWPRLRLLGWLLALLTAMAAVGLLAIWVLLRPTMTSPPAANFPRPTSLADANLQDLSHLERFGEVNRSFTPETRAAFLADVKALEARAGELDRAALEMGVARAVAHADDGHTNVRGAAWGLSLNSVPVRLAWFGDELRVVAAAPALADMVGAKVISEDGHSPPALLHALRPYLGGPASLLREHAPFLMISPQALHAAGLADAPDRLTFVLQDLRGSVTTRTVAAEPAPANGPPVAAGEATTRRENRWPRRYLSPIPFPGDGRAWTTLIDAGPGLPLYLSHPDDFYWRARLPGGGLYVQINATEDQQGRPDLESFLKAITEEARRSPPPVAIVDLRFNPGGNAATVIAFSRDLPAALPKATPLYIVTSGNTFSAGIITAARLKYYGGARARIVGERIGDNEAFWAEGQSFVLPNSGVAIKSTTAFHDWAHGCSIQQIGYCYLFNYLWRAPAGDLSPTVPAPMKFDDYKAGQDSVLKAIGLAG